MKWNPENETIRETSPLSDRAKREAIAIRRDYRDQLAGRDVHIASEGTHPTIPAVGWNKVDTRLHRHQAMLDRAALRRRPA